MTQHSRTVQKLDVPRPPHPPRHPRVDESSVGSRGSPLGEGKRQHPLAQERAEWGGGQNGAVCRMKFSPNQSQAQPSSPSLMESFQPMTDSSHSRNAGQPLGVHTNGGLLGISGPSFLACPSARLSCDLSV